MNGSDDDRPSSAYREYMVDICLDVLEHALRASLHSLLAAYHSRPRHQYRPGQRLPADPAEAATLLLTRQDDLADAIEIYRRIIEHRRRQDLKSDDDSSW